MARLSMTKMIDAKELGIDTDGIDCKACGNDDVTIKVEANREVVVIHYVCNNCGKKRRLTYKRDKTLGRTNPDVAGCESDDN